MSIPSMRNSEIAVLVLSTRDQAYDSFRDAVYSAWLRSLIDLGIVCYLYAGDYQNEKIVGHEMQLTAPDNLLGTGAKLCAAIKLLFKLHPEIKVIYRTNLSSYIEPVNFLKYVHSRNIGTKSYVGILGTTTVLREKFYCYRLFYYVIGFLRLGKKIRFASGSGFFLGAELAKKLLSVPTDKSLVDDVMVAVALGKIPDNYNVPNRFDILENGQHRISKEEYDRLINEEFLFHYRFKTSNRITDAQLLSNFCDPDLRMKICVERNSD